MLNKIKRFLNKVLLEDKLVIYRKNYLLKGSGRVYYDYLPYRLTSDGKCLTRDDGEVLELTDEVISKCKVLSDDVSAFNTPWKFDKLEYLNISDFPIKDEVTVVIGEGTYVLTSEIKTLGNFLDLVYEGEKFQEFMIEEGDLMYDGDYVIKKEPSLRRYAMSDGVIYDTSEHERIRITPSNMINLNTGDLIYVNGRKCRYIPHKSDGCIYYYDLDEDITDNRFKYSVLNSNRFTQSSEVFYVYVDGKRLEFIAEIDEFSNKPLDVRYPLSNDLLPLLKKGTTLELYDCLTGELSNISVEEEYNGEYVVMSDDTKVYKSRVSGMGKVMIYSDHHFLLGNKSTKLKKVCTAEDMLTIAPKVPIYIEGYGEYYVKIAAKDHKHLVMLKEVKGDQVIPLQQTQLSNGELPYTIYRND